MTAETGLSLRQLNIFERAECMVDTAGKGNLNFSIVASHHGRLDGHTVRAGLQYLQKMHPLLRVGPDTTDKITTFVETGADVPFRELPYEGKDQWRSVIKEELKKRFNRLEEPLWKVCLLKGENEGQLIVTFHHAIADGVCGMPMMNHLYQIFASLLNGQEPSLNEFNTPVPDFHSLYPLSSKEPIEDTSIEIEEEKEHIQDFLTDIIDERTTKKIIDFSRANNIKVHAILFAALLMSVKEVLKPDFDKLNAVSAVNYRSSFKPPFSSEVLALMRTLIQEEFSISDHVKLTDFAKVINTSVHSQLDAGEHVLNLKALEKRLERGASPQELLQRCKFPLNSVGQSNVGALNFTGHYSDSQLALNELFFFADITPFCSDRVNVVLGTLTFRDKVSLSLWYLADLVKEEEAKAILTSMKERLASSL